MKNKSVNARVVWKQLDDVLVPRLRLSALERAVYSYLFRHSWLEGKRCVRFSIPWLAQGIRVSASPARQAVRRLIELGALRLVERTKAGHVVEVRLPEEIRAVRLEAVEAGNETRAAGAGQMEEMDFLQSKALRQAIHARERGHCFYCLRRTNARKQCLDHVVLRVGMGGNSYRNLVSCCMECNSKKGEMPAKDFLRWLFREDRLSSVELTRRVRALKMLAAGRMRPAMGSK